ncbi:Purine-binding protein BAB2_0673 [uncultured delta proteobacterium]|uniref:Purine-binding protein BAB2_0673 n=1 Tax=uncultured delta proteobacterium TaxID=34034 RepID=A0A212JJ62_9DELT|nr:Purine-binding protein BAB2_0673 [uncultured delta proteobacterium]
MRSFAAALLAAAVCILFPVTAPAAEKPVTVGFVYISPAGEVGWSHSHDLARRALAAMPGVTAVFKENVPEGREAEQAIREMAQQGCDIIFTTSFGYMDPTLTVAKEFPAVTFLHCSGFKTAPNVSTYFGRVYQVRFLTGMVAGAMTKSNIIGYAAAYPIPEVIRGINAFTLGAQAVNPKVEVRVVWTKTWYDEAKERDAAMSLITGGADVVAQHQDSPAAQQAAEARGVYSVGYHTDMSAFAPKAHLVAAVWNWVPFYKDVLAKVRKGEWRSSDSWPGLESGVVGLSPFGPMVPQAVRDKVLTCRDAIARGAMTVFTGPILDQNGKIRIKAGEKADDATLLNMNWFVLGVTATL